MGFLDAHITCGCCGYHASEAKLNEMSLALTEKALVDYAGLTRILRAETNDAPFVPSEVRLTELLASNADRIASKIESPIYDVLTRTGYVDEAKITAALKAAGSVWEVEAWPKGLENQYRVVLAQTALLGQHDIPFGPELSDFEKLKIVNGMSKSTKYYTSRYFNTQVMPAIVDAAHASVLNGTSHDGAELQAIRELLDRRLRSVPYWNLVANAAASRSYHYGYLKTGVAHGLQTVEFVATVDNRTSAVCLSLNGTEWRAADVALFADKIADAEGDNIKNVAPWPRAADVAGKTPDELLAMGVVIPPVHGFCRSQLFFN